MRDKIVEAIWDELGCGYDGELIDVGDGTDKILKTISEEIKKVENPWKHIMIEDGRLEEAQDRAFEECRQKILALFK